MSENKLKGADDWWGEQPTVKKLRASGRLPHIAQLCASRWKAPAIGPKSIEEFLESVAVIGTRELTFAEKLTKQQRIGLAERIGAAAEQLSQDLQPLLPGGISAAAWQFQSELDLLSLHLTNEYIDQRHGGTVDGEIDAETWRHCVRFGIYHVMLDCLPRVLDCIADTARWWADGETTLPRPNHRNARRLFFIRSVTRSFLHQFHAPMRAATFELASVYFDTADLQEADLSRLAPVDPRWRTLPNPRASED